MAWSGYGIGEVEDAIIQALKDDATLAQYVRTIDRLPWELGGELGSLVKQYPALLVAYAGGEDRDETASTSEHRARFIILCCAQNLRSAGAALANEVGEKGIYDLLKDVFNCLQDSTLGGLDIYWCRSVRVDPVAATARLAVFGREFEVWWRMEGA